MTQSIFASKRPQSFNLEVDDTFATANELMCLYVYKLLQKTTTPEGHWFTKWAKSYLDFYHPFLDNLYDADETKARLLELDDSSANALKLFDKVYAALPRLTAGETIEDLLLNPQNLAMWEAYFHVDTKLYQQNNFWLAQAVKKRIKPGDYLLEIGGGFGSAAITLADEVDPETAQQCKLQFTELVPFFLGRAKRNLRNNHFETEFKSLDLNNLALQENTFDIIYGANVLHVVKDLEKCLNHLFKSLKPGGRLIICEAIRPILDVPIYPEFVFGFFKDFHQAKITQLRTKGGFLSKTCWQNLFDDAGFEDVDAFPNINCDPTNYPFVFGTCITGKKP